MLDGSSASPTSSGFLEFITGIHRRYHHIAGEDVRSVVINEDSLLSTRRHWRILLIEKPKTDAQASPKSNPHPAHGATLKAGLCARQGGAGSAVRATSC